MQDRTVPMPRGLQVKLNAILNANPNFPNIAFDQIEVGLTEWFNPKFVLSRAQFSNSGTAAGMRFGALDVVFDGPALVLGNIALKSVQISDAF